MVGKFHYYSIEQNEKLPEHIKEQHYPKMEYAAIDGFIRPRCTSIIPLVTCKLCLTEMKKQGIIKAK